MWRRILENWRAWKRGETRVAPQGVRGRVYERKAGGGPMQAVSRFKATMKVRVYRAATGKWEER